MGVRGPPELWKPFQNTVICWAGGVMLTSSRGAAGCKSAATVGLGTAVGLAVGAGVGVAEGVGAAVATAVGRLVGVGVWAGVATATGRLVGAGVATGTGVDLRTVGVGMGVAAGVGAASSPQIRVKRRSTPKIARKRCIIRRLNLFLSLTFRTFYSSLSFGSFGYVGLIDGQLWKCVL